MCSRYLMMRRCGWLSDVERSTPVIGGSVARFRLTVFFAASMQPCSVGNSSTGYPGRRDVIITRGACRCFVYCLGLYRSGTIHNAVMISEKRFIGSCSLFDSPSWRRICPRGARYLSEPTDRQILMLRMTQRPIEFLSLGDVAHFFQSLCARHCS